jgi:hypothetical protein
VSGAPGPAFRNAPGSQLAKRAATTGGAMIATLRLLVALLLFLLGNETAVLPFRLARGAERHRALLVRSRSDPGRSWSQRRCSWALLPSSGLAGGGGGCGRRASPAGLVWPPQARVALVLGLLLSPCTRAPRRLGRHRPRYGASSNPPTGAWPDAGARSRRGGGRSRASSCASCGGPAGGLAGDPRRRGLDGLALTLAAGECVPPGRRAGFAPDGAALLLTPHGLPRRAGRSCASRLRPGPILTARRPPRCSSLVARFLCRPPFARPSGRGGRRARHDLPRADSGARLGDAR